MKLVLILLLATLCGCAKVNPPINLSLIHDDCSNQAAIIRWLEKQASLIQDGNDQNETYKYNIKARIWQLRYNCNLL